MKVKNSKIKVQNFGACFARELFYENCSVPRSGTPQFLFLHFALFL